MNLLLFPSILSIFLFSPPLFQDQAERLFENANTFLTAGKYKEALADFQNIAANYSDTSWAARALLEIGNYYLNIKEEPGSALTYYSRIQREYAHSEVAPAAYFAKAVIVEKEGSSTAELEAAVADLIRMSTLYPNNAWNKSALFLFGKLAMRLKDYETSLSYFQRLEFNYPRSEHLPRALLLGARVAYLMGAPSHAAITLARLQSNFPNSPEARLASAYMSLLDRFTGSSSKLELDQSFFAARPKAFQHPARVTVNQNELVAIKDQQGAHFASLGSSSPPMTVPSKDIVGFCKDREDQILIVYKNRLANKEGTLPFPALTYQGSPIRDIRSAALDAFGRVFIIDGNERDLLVFSKTGEFLKNFSLGKPQSVRCFAGDIYVLNNADSIDRYDSSFAPRESGVMGANAVTDFDIDPFGNLYVLSDRGSKVKIYSYGGELKVTANLKSGTFPLKQAQAIGVDAAGAVYLCSRRDGAVYRFH